MAGNPLVSQLEKTVAEVSQRLLAERCEAGHWVGELSSSALSTATAVCALTVVEKAAPDLVPANVGELIAGGLEWLAAHQNEDGGWGDTVRSLSNISTTTLCYAAFGIVTSADSKFRNTVRAAETWLEQQAGGLAPEKLVPAIVRRYGKDRTFSVPILTMCALSGRLGTAESAWKWVLPLPFELAACPHQWFAVLRLPVVSYALPALIAIGQARHFHLPSRNPVARFLRNLTRRRTLEVLRGIQPKNGGFLEATPLTSFVVMSLGACGNARHPVTVRGVDFLVKSARPDGSWAIDTNLATWVTTLSINALSRGANPENLHQVLSAEDRSNLLDFLLKQQYLAEHPYTHAPPGAWAWTDLPGGVPDADDTAGALLALRVLDNVHEDSPNQQGPDMHQAQAKATAPWIAKGPCRFSEGKFTTDVSQAQSASDSRVRRAAEAGIHWLLNLQNRDGGIPTFCRGWGALPFDRSSPDLTAHALRAWKVWLPDCSPELRPRIETGIQKALDYLRRTQRADGTWVPLWFGNQFASDDENFTYGTSRVLLALEEFPETADLWWKGADWLIRAQAESGGWGGFVGSSESVEETALAVEALAGGVERKFLNQKAKGMHLDRAVQRGAFWLMEQWRRGLWAKATPIGFYFAKLWYFERLYPLMFGLAALRRTVENSGVLAEMGLGRKT